MKQVVIYYFSGTGNTELIADLYKDNFEKVKYEVKLLKIEDILKGKQKIVSENIDYIGLAHPVYAGEAPSIFNDFIKMLPDNEGRRIFIFKTAGDFAKINYPATKYAIKILKKKGYNIIHDSLIVMNSNWLFTYKDEVAKQLYKHAVLLVEKNISQIINNISKEIKINLLTILMVRIFNYFEENWGARFFGKFLKVKKNCINCGKCIKDCPVDNIYKKQNKIKFKFKCIFCMRCLYNCPVNAIKAGSMGFTVLKNGYNINKIINNPNIKSDFITNKTKGFYKHFIKYLNLK